MTVKPRKARSQGPAAPDRRRHATTGLALADTLTFGGAEFHNVLFLVMPDAALTFKGGAYVVQGIIGLPILLELGRIECSTVIGAEALHYTRTSGTPGVDSNLMLESEVPTTFAHIDGLDRTMRLFIDNGARTTHLNKRFVADFRAIAAQAHHASVTRTGGAGSETQDALKLPSIGLKFGQTTSTITDVDVIEDHQKHRHGDFGLDALRNVRGHVLDFDAMHFELLPVAPSFRPVSVSYGPKH